jgi:aryl-alcohol dehydrogenase-like predicted oxidoreductase
MNCNTSIYGAEGPCDDIDRAPPYGDSEEKLGAALEPYRNQVVIATKVFAKETQGAAKELAMSLDRLRTDRLDLIQCHDVSGQEDLERVLGSEGAYHVLTKAPLGEREELALACPVLDTGYLIRG